MESCIILGTLWSLMEPSLMTFLSDPSVFAAWKPSRLVFTSFGFCEASAELVRSLVFASWMPYRLVFASCGFCGASAELLRAFFVHQVSLGKKRDWWWR